MMMLMEVKPMGLWLLSVPGLPQTLQRAELWGVLLALQAADNLSIVRHLGRLLDGNFGPCPAELAKDGDLVFTHS